MTNQFSLFEEKIDIKDIGDSIRLIKKKEWKFDKYKLQSWGHPLHKIAPYVGRIKPSFAHFLIKYLSVRWLRRAPAHGHSLTHSLSHSLTQSIY